MGGDADVATESPRVRPARVADAGGIAAVYNAHVASGRATFDVRPWQAAAVAELLRVPPPDGWYVAESGSAVVGWASARRFSDRHGFRHSCETAIYLADSAIGRGIADRLQAAIERHCLSHRLHHAVAKVIADNHRSLKFHQRHGYEHVGVQRQIGRLQGRWVDLVILQRLFPLTDPDD